MIRLMYFSTATRHINEFEVDEIMRSSAEKNRACGVTGMLAFNGRNFCQVLEGDEHDVHSLIHTIRGDARHAGFKVLGEKPIDARQFDDWSITHVNDLDFSQIISAMDA